MVEKWTRTELLYLGVYYDRIWALKANKGSLSTYITFYFHSTSFKEVQALKHLLLALAITCMLATPAMSEGSGGGDPPDVTVYGLTPWGPVDSITVLMYEPVTLVGVGGGEMPLYYYWYLGESDPALITTGALLEDYMFTAPGEYVITVEVIDVNNYSATDSVIITVLNQISTELTTWGRIKELYR